MAKGSLRQKQLKQEKGFTDISQPLVFRGDQVTLPIPVPASLQRSLVWVDAVSADPFRPLESWERWVKAEHT